MHKKLPLAALISSALSFNAFANFNDQVNSYKAHEHSLIHSESQALAKARLKSRLNTEQNLALVNHVIAMAKGSYNKNIPHGGRAARGAILFVSFSMPTPLIIQMSQQAAQFHIPVMLRGLVDNNMPKTLQRLMDIKQAAKKQSVPFSGIGIDPVWFDQFAITAVPALVVTLRPARCIAQKVCKDQPFDVVYGNSSINRSLNLIATEGSKAIAPIAKEILSEDRRGDSHG